MEQAEGNNWKTAWEQVAEEEWKNEQYAADEDRRVCQSPGLQLQPEAIAALGGMNPENAWSQITMLVMVVIDEHREDAEKLGQQLGIGGYWIDPTDLDQLYIRATELNPIFAVNEFNYVNPEIRLDRPRLFEEISPLDALRAVIKMWTQNSHRNEAF